MPGLPRVLATVAAVVGIAALSGGCTGARDGGDGVEASAKFRLWASSTQLRGANIHQRRIYPELDGDAYGPGPFGVPYTQGDFDELAALGANYVNISHPGLYSEDPPFELDVTAQANLDSLLEMIAAADMFAVITYRTGPGRAEFSFWGDTGDLPPGHVNDTVWEDAAAQDGWVAMWRYTAERYRDNPIVVGYDLMCEPNSNGLRYDIWNPEDFYPAHAGALEDWNQLFPRITAAIREVDETTPILVSAMSWGAVTWLPAVVPTGDERTVYAVHQYAPQEQYTHQDAEGANGYPGLYDVDYDNVPDNFDRAWIESYLEPISTFSSQHGAPVAVNEFGVRRWVPDAAAFMRDQMDLLEGIGVSYALWAWLPTSFDILDTQDEFDFRLGPDPSNHVPTANDLQDAITSAWARNTARPSNTDTR